MQACASRAADHAIATLKPGPGLVVAGYSAIGSEMGTAPLLARLARLGCVLVLPSVVSGGDVLVFRRYRPGDPLQAGPYGTREPLPEAPQVSPQVVIVPLLAFDRAGHRLGYGGGYYDRTLRALRAEAQVTAVGLAFAVQEIESVPHEATDERLDMVITDRGVSRFTGVG